MALFYWKDDEGPTRTRADIIRGCFTAVCITGQVSLARVALSITEEDWDPSLANYSGEHSRELSRYSLILLGGTCVVCASFSVVSDSLQLYELQPARAFCPWDFPGKNTGMGCHFFLQGIFLTQGLNLGLLDCRQTLYGLSQQEI